MVWPARGILSGLGVQAHWTFEPISTSMDIIVAGAPSPPNTHGLPEDKKKDMFTVFRLYVKFLWHKEFSLGIEKLFLGKEVVYSTHVTTKSELFTNSE